MVAGAPVRRAARPWPPPPPADRLPRSPATSRRAAGRARRRAAWNRPSASGPDRRRSTNPSTPRSRRPRRRIGRAGGGRVGERRRLRVGDGIGEHRVVEGDHHVAGLGQPGVLHEDDDLEVATVVEQPVDGARREPHERTGSDRRLRMAVTRERGDPAGAGHHHVGLGAGGVAVRCSAGLAVGRDRVVHPEVAGADATGEGRRSGRGPVAAGDRTLEGHGPPTPPAALTGPPRAPLPPCPGRPGLLDPVDVPRAVVDDDAVADAERLAGTHLEGVVEEEGGVEEVRPALAVGRGPGAPVEGDGVPGVVRVVEHRDAGGRVVDRPREVDPAGGLADHPLLLGSASRSRRVSTKSPEPRRARPP